MRYKAVSNLKSKPWYKIIKIVYIVFVSTLSVGILIVFVYSSIIIGKVSDKTNLVVYFKDNVAENDILRIGQELKREPGVNDVKYISKGDALKIFKEMRSDDQEIQNITSENNPLPASLELDTKEYGDLVKANSLFEENGKYAPLTDQTSYDQNNKAISQLWLIRWYLVGALAIFLIPLLISVLLIII